MKKSIYNLSSVILLTLSGTAYGMEGSPLAKQVQKRLTTHLVDALKYRKLQEAERLLAFGADVNMKVNGFTPMAFAIMSGYLNFVKKCIEHGADVNQQTPNGITPLMLASSTEI